jgi:hypothetical protein
MASEREAESARAEHSEFLRRKGAHAVAVEEVRRGGEKTYCVVAFFEREPGADVPDALKIGRGKKETEVPLVARVAERFKPE